MELSEEEKKTALRDAAVATLREMQRRAPELRQISQTAHDVFRAFLTAPIHYIGESPKPEGFVPPSETWSVTAKVTVK